MEPDRAKRVVTAAIVVTALVTILVFAAVVLFWPTEVPDIRTLPLESAEESLERSGFSMGEQSLIATTALGPGRVFAQQPASSTRVPKRSSVDVTVTVTPVSVDVPDVVGMSEESAMRTLADALYLPSALEVFDTEHERGTVIKQVPAGGTSWLTGRPVAFGVAAGPDDGRAVVVPDIEGMTIPDALETLEAAGLRGEGFVMNPQAPEAARAVDQLPEGGTRVAPGSLVLLVFEIP